MTEQTPPINSRSVLRRVALQKGEPMPTFVNEQTPEQKLHKAVREAADRIVERMDERDGYWVDEIIKEFVPMLTDSLAAQKCPCNPAECRDEMLWRDALATASLAGKMELQTQACKELCEECHAGLPVAKNELGFWYHDGVPCAAGDIRELPLSPHSQETLEEHVRSEVEKAITVEVSEIAFEMREGGLSRQSIKAELDKLLAEERAKAYERCAEHAKKLFDDPAWIPVDCNEWAAAERYAHDGNQTGG